jgi:hypothetical protein
LLTIWTYEDIYTIQSAGSTPPDMTLEISPATLSRLSNETYVVHRGGGQFYGRWVLFDHLNSRIGLEENTDLLRLKVAEVLIDYGSVVLPVNPGGVDGEVVDDGDEDGFSDLFTSPSAAFSGVTYGDRLTVTYPSSDVEITFVNYAIDGVSLRISPPLPEGTGLIWVLERNSVSSALEEVDRLRGQMQEFRDVVNNYVIPKSSASVFVVDAVLDLLREQRLDRAVDLLYDGNIDEFIQLDDAGGSYATRARTSVQTAGRNTSLDSSMRSNISGVDPETGKPSKYSTRATSSHSVMNYLDEDDTRVILADGVADLVDDELMRSLLFTTDEEQRNRAIYTLGGLVESSIIADDDPTLPWVAKTGSRKQRLHARFEKLKASIQYMIDHPDEFCEAPLEDEQPTEFEIPQSGDEVAP